MPSSSMPQSASRAKTPKPGFSIPCWPPMPLLRTKASQSICQDNATDGFAIVRFAPVETLDADSLAGIVAALVPIATEWRRKLAEMQYTISDN